MRSEPTILRRLLAATLVILAAPGAAAAVDAIDEAASRVFPPPLVLEREIAALAPADVERVVAHAGTRPPSARVERVVARPAHGGAPVGYAYVDRHLVRTLEETLLVALDAAGRVERIEVVTFAEPREYLPSPRWYAQMEGRALDRQLDLKRGIRTLAGATLSSRAATDAVRRVLAVHEVLAARPGLPP